MTKLQSKVMRGFQTHIITGLSKGSLDTIILKNPLFLKWLVGYLAENRQPYQLIPMGENVTKVIFGGETCPLCCGKGFFDGTAHGCSTHADYTVIQKYERLFDKKGKHVCNCPPGGCIVCKCKQDKEHTHHQHHQLAMPNENVMTA